MNAAPGTIEEKRRKVLIMSVGLTLLIIVAWAVTFDIPPIEEGVVAENTASPANPSFFETVRVGFSEIKNGLLSLVGVN